MARATAPSPTRSRSCHTSGDTTYKTKPYAMACAGCHVQDTNTALDHMRQSGSPF